MYVTKFYKLHSENSSLENILDYYPQKISTYNLFEKLFLE